MPVKTVDLSKLRSAALQWTTAKGASVVTVVVKATYRIHPGVCPLADEPDDVNLRDLHKENNPEKGLHSASDMVPYKPLADVMLVGRAYAPPKELSRSLIARLQVGNVNKEVEVHAERFIDARGKLACDAFFSKMSLGYEKAAGGPKTVNPVGVARDARVDANGRRLLPNLQRPGDDPVTLIAPVGFGPVSKDWPQRQSLLVGVDRSWLDSKWESSAVPPDWNWTYFNVAPHDQRTKEILPDQGIVMDHLHPDHPHLDTRLPGVQPATFVQRDGKAHPVPLKGDTLWIDTTRKLLTLTWRGQVKLNSPSESLRFLVGMSRPGKMASWDDVRSLYAEHKRKADDAVHDRRTQIKPARASHPDSSRHSLEPPSVTNVMGPSSGVPSSGAPSSPASSTRQQSTPLPSSIASPVPPPSIVTNDVLTLPLMPADRQMLTALAQKYRQSPEELLRSLILDAYTTIASSQRNK